MKVKGLRWFIIGLIFLATVKDSHLIFNASIDIKCVIMC